MPPLPHHRAYGSVPRRFGGLGPASALHGGKSEAAEAGLREAEMKRFARADAPRPPRTHDGREGRLPGDAEAAQLVETLWSGLPLDPGGATKASRAPDNSRPWLKPK